MRWESWRRAAAPGRMCLKACIVGYVSAMGAWAGEGMESRGNYASAATDDCLDEEYGLRSLSALDGEGR